MDQIKTFYKNKKVLITGVTGFKGSWLAMILLQFGAKVYGIGHNPNRNKKLFYDLNLQKKIKLKIIDINNYDSLLNYSKKIKPVIIFHLAAQPLIYESYRSPYETINVNSLGTLNILDISKIAEDKIVEERSKNAENWKQDFYNQMVTVQNLKSEFAGLLVLPQMVRKKQNRLLVIRNAPYNTLNRSLGLEPV